ncbi:MAG: dienelactone hydrolase family protein [Acidobacteriota bacterium]
MNRVQKSILVGGLALIVSVLPSFALDPAADEAAKMHAAHQHEAPAPTPAAEAAPKIPVSGVDVVYATLGGKPVKGYLAAPRGVAPAHPLPGIIVIHEWWGLNDNVRSMARRLAGEGYVALAVDLYAGASATDGDAAQKLMQGVLKDTDTATANLKAAYEFLETQQKAPKIGVVGWCFGGGWSLATALALPDKIDATAIYYGRLVQDPEKLKPLQMPIIGFFGGLDTGISPADISSFETTLRSLGKTVTTKTYPDAKHGFANSSGQAYNAAAAEDAWKLTVAFFAKNLK